MKVVILGPTGVVGHAIVRAALEEPRISAVVAVSRRPLNQQHPRLAVALHNNFADFTALECTLAGTDVVLCALGLSWYQAKGEAEYRQVTRDYVMACAHVASIANPAIRFCFVSGQGAAANGSQAWARIKAETEHDLEATFGSRLNVFRPGYIYPTRGRPTPYWGDTVMKPLMPFRGSLSRWITDCDEVACAVLHAAVGGTVPSPATNRDIIAAASAYAASRRH